MYNITTLNFSSLSQYNPLVTITDSCLLIPNLMNIVIPLFIIVVVLLFITVHKPKNEKVKDLFIRIQIQLYGVCLVLIGVLGLYMYNFS